MNISGKSGKSSGGKREQPTLIMQIDFYYLSVRDGSGPAGMGTAATPIAGGFEYVHM